MTAPPSPGVLPTNLALEPERPWLLGSNFAGPRQPAALPDSEPSWGPPHAEVHDSLSPLAWALFPAQEFTAEHLHHILSSSAEPYILPAPSWNQGRVWP